MKRMILVAAILCGLVIGTETYAQRRMPVAAHKQMHQQHRIQQGKHSGELTKHEARHLHVQQRIIKHERRIAMADGRVTPRERQIINRHQGRANRSIYRMKHNNRYR